MTLIQYTKSDNNKLIHLCLDIWPLCSAYKPVNLDEQLKIELQNRVPEKQLLNQAIEAG